MPWSWSRWSAVRIRFDSPPPGKRWRRKRVICCNARMRMLEKVRRAHAGESLRVGYPLLASGLLSVAMERFTQLHPQARVTLSDLTSTEMLAGLRRGQTGCGDHRAAGQRSHRRRVDRTARARSGK